MLTLALGIGANTAIFGVVNKLLLNPLPYADADRLVFVGSTSRACRSRFPMPDSVVRALRDEARTLDGVEAYTPRNVLAYDETGARALRGMRITPGLPAFLGVVPPLGRGFTPADAEAGAPAVVMLSYEMWQRDYGGASDVLGRTLTLDEVAHVVVGVLPPRWGAVRARAAALTCGSRCPSIPQVSRRRGFNAIDVLGRLRPGVSARGSEAGDRRDPRPRAGRSAAADVRRRRRRPRVSMARRTDSAEHAREALLVLLGAVGLVLLVACSNVANLLLARSASRARELSLRSALGASTWRLVRALLAECLVLALAAGVVGVALGWAMLRILVRLRPDSLGAPLGEVQLDSTGARVHVRACRSRPRSCSAWRRRLQLTSRKLGDALRHGASGVVRGGSGARVRKLLVAAQMALSVVLLVSAGLARAQLHQPAERRRRLRHREPAHGPALAAARPLRAAGEPRCARRAAARCGCARCPASPPSTQALTVPPNYMTMSAATSRSAESRSARPTRTAPAAQLCRGRTTSPRSAFACSRGARSRPTRLRSGGAVIVNRAAAQHFWPEGNALGAEMKWGSDWVTVIGVVDDVASGGLMRGKDEPQFYLPYRSRARRRRHSARRRRSLLIVRAAGDPAIAIASLRAATRALDPEIAIPTLLADRDGAREHDRRAAVQHGRC